MSNKLLDLKEILGEEKSEINIITHNFPDPDAIASALGIHHLLKILNYKPGRIYYSGEISHPQNKSMITLLKIEMANYEDQPFEDGSKVILVDTNNLGPESNQHDIDASNADVVAVFDHHKGKHPKGSQVDSRKVGATSSIIWEYLQKYECDFESEEGRILATALILGIFTDTNMLMSDNISDLDFEAFKSLVPKVDKQKLLSIMEYPLPHYLFELRQRAFMEENNRIEQSTIVSGIGVISKLKRDAIPIIADEFLRMSGITTSIVFAIVEDCLDISIRSKNITLDVNDFVQKVFGTGGGKSGAGRAKIPLGFFAAGSNKELDIALWDLTKEQVFLKVFSNVKAE